MRQVCILITLLSLGAGPAFAQAQPPRWQLAAAFVNRDSVALRRFFTSDVMIWPPSPDTARRGDAAIRYFIDLALASRLARSEFRPRSVTTDGAYLIEDGTWMFTHGRTRVRARYDLRWRQADGRWRVSFLKWDLFR
jgi:ketosteroid isomerase-like protein